jgi:hypothetical protein
VREALGRWAEAADDYRRALDVAPGEDEGIRRRIITRLDLMPAG